MTIDDHIRKLTSLKLSEETDHRPLIIAEVGINHNGNPALAREMVLAAHKAGADLVKIQSFVMEDFFSPNLDYYNETASLSLSFEDQEQLFQFASDNEIPLITTPFDFKSVDFLDKFDVKAYKVASMDCNNYTLIKYIAEKGKPIFLSTGMATIGEIEKAVKTIEDANNDNYFLLHCVSDYPTKLEHVNLNFMIKLKEIFNCSIGISDHTIGLDSVLIAAALGADIIEKHFTTNKDFAKDFPGTDHDISLTPEEIKKLRAFCENVPIMKGSKTRKFTENEKQGRTETRRGWYAREDINAGEIFGLSNLVALRPVRGIPVSEADIIMGMKSSRQLLKGQAVQYQDLEK